MEVLSRNAAARLGVIVAIVAAGTITILVPDELNGEHMKRYSFVPGKFYTAWCDTNGIEMHRLTRDIEAYEKSYKKDRNESNELNDAEIESMKSLIAMSTLHRQMNTEESARGQELAQKLYEMSRSQAAAAEQRLSSKLQKLQDWRSELNARQIADVHYQSPPMVFGDLKDMNGKWYFMLGESGYERYYRVKLNWLAYVSIVTVSFACGWLAVVVLWYVVAAASMALRMIGRWIVGGQHGRRQ